MGRKKRKAVVSGFSDSVSVSVLVCHCMDKVVLDKKDKKGEEKRRENQW